MVERGALTAEQFRNFTYANPLRLHSSMNPDFFAGTVCERVAAAMRTEGELA